MSIFEIAMLVCFGAAWPVSIYKSLKTREVAGKSLPFLVIVLVGYMAGILHKLVFRYDLVIFLYILNAVMVALDIILYMRNRLYHVRKSLSDAKDAQRRGETGQ
ncbi:MAG: hypothetical protein ABSF77_07535 [Spirochaetia bacterium]